MTHITLMTWMEGTETIAVFDEEHREVIHDLLAEVKRLREIEREWKQMWSKLEDYPDICAELICFMESEEE